MRILMKHTLSALKVVKDAYIDETYFIGPALKVVKDAYIDEIYFIGP